MRESAMSKIKGLSFYKTDKDIFDQLVQKTPSKSSVLEHLKQRGLLFSHLEDMQELAETISPWFTSYFDQKFIVGELGGGTSKKKHNSLEIELDYKKSDIDSILQELKKECEFQVSKNKNNSFDITKNYTKADFTKNSLSQNTQKSAEIKIEETENGNILIRSNTDEQATKIIGLFKEKLKEKNADDYKEFEINLSIVAKPDDRTKFFIELINGIDDYELVDVASALINKFTITQEADEDIVGFIKKIALDGDSVHTSSEFNRLTNDGFYITKIEWTIKSCSSTGDKIDLLAEFSDTTNCSDFKYSIKRIYSLKENGEYNSGKPPSEMERMIILPKIELSAKKSYGKIMADYLIQTSEINENS